MSDGAAIAIVTGLAGIVTSIVGLVTFYLKLKYGQKVVEDKVDHNTNITAQAGVAAVTNAQVAAGCASDAKEAVEAVNKKLNGGIDEAIQAAVRPIMALLDAHTKQDARDLEEVKAKFDKLEEYDHQRNHKILNVINRVVLGVEVVAAKMGVVLPKLEEGI